MAGTEKDASPAGCDIAPFVNDVEEATAHHLEKMVTKSEMSAERRCMLEDNKQMHHAGERKSNVKTSY